MTGIVTLSIELELGWGMHDQAEYDHLSSDRSAETKALHRLLDIADRHDIPITFNVVGHLFHDSCPGSHRGPHPESWWTEDPGTSSDSDPLFYAPDLIEEIRNRETVHEIATHTYSHLLAELATSKELDHELATVAELHDDVSLPAPTSIVMPRHREPDYSVIGGREIDTIRRPIEGYCKPDMNPFLKFWWLIMREHPKSTLEWRNGILETTVTPFPSLTAVSLPVGQSRPHPVFSAIPEFVRIRRHRKFLFDAIDKAKEEDSHVHLWTHLYNFANDIQWHAMKPGLNRIGVLHCNDSINVVSMRNLSEIQ